MKIYCTLRNIEDDIGFLSQMIGRDAWVKIRSHTGNIVWVRIISEDLNSYIVNVLDCHNNSPYMPKEYKTDYLSRTTRYRKNHITVCKPLDIMTTEDIFCL